MSVVAVWHVQRVLAKKRDPLTHVLFIDECQDEQSPLPSEHIWYVDGLLAKCDLHAGMDI